MSEQLALEHSAGLNEETSIDGLVRNAHRLVKGVSGKPLRRGRSSTSPDLENWTIPGVWNEHFTS